MWTLRPSLNNLNVTGTSKPYSLPCVIRLISQIGKRLSKLSTVSPDKHKFLRSCCSMSAIAATLSNRMQRILNSVCNFYPFQCRRKLNLRFLGKRTLKNIASQVDKKIEDFRTTLIKLHNAFMDEAAVITEITAFQILDDMGIISANVGKISSQLDGMANQLKWVSSHVSDSGTYSSYLQGYRPDNGHRARCQD